MLQVSWVADDVPSEMMAYEEIAAQYYLVKDLKRSAYYRERATRGDSECISSKVRQVSQIQYDSKLKKRNERYPDEVKEQQNSYTIDNRVDYNRVEDYCKRTSKRIVNI
jgi:hypothetical protein